MSILVAPSILSADFGKMAEAVENIKNWGADIVHCDVMDGVFVPNFTFGMPMVKSLRKYTQQIMDCHLMMIEPEKYVERFCDAGADYVTFHPDASKNVGECLYKILQKGKKCGLAINPDKSLDLVEPYLDKIDMLVIMSVYAGFGGQKFIEESIEKIQNAKNLIEQSKRKILIEVDGGVTTENAKKIADAGADVLVAGSAVFGAGNPSEAVQLIKGNF